MTLSITVDDNFYSETVRTEADGRIFHLKLTSIDPTSDPEAFFTSKDEVETYIRSIGNDDPRWLPESFIGSVNDDLTSKWYLIAPDGSFEKQCIFYNWNPLLRVKFTSKEEVESFDTQDEKMRHIRLIRDRKLRLKADPKTVECLSKGVELSDEWKNYIQKLRDLPATYESDPDSVVLPDAP